LELLAALTHPPDAPPLLLLAAMWPAQACSSEQRAGLARAFREGDTLELVIGALPAEAAIELARQLLRAGPR
jgi:hypothetical protein